MDALIYVANGLYLASYFMTDILRLRLLTITAASVLAAYFSALPEPLWTVVGWNMVFVALNAMQIVRALRSRRARPATPRRAGADEVVDVSALLECGDLGCALF